MSERIDTVLRYLILIYGAVCIYGYLSLVIPEVSAIRLIDDLTFVHYGTAVDHYSKCYQYIILAVLGVFRFILFGKIYQKQVLFQQTLWVIRKCIPFLDTDKLH